MDDSSGLIQLLIDDKESRVIAIQEHKKPLVMM